MTIKIYVNTVTDSVYQIAQLEKRSAMKRANGFEYPSRNILLIIIMYYHRAHTIQH